MPELLLRGQSIGEVGAVLFDKDGTLSHSEPMLHALASARVRECLRLAGLHHPSQIRLQALQDLLLRAYGIDDQSVHPAGSLAVASRDHNLIATATAFVQAGFEWPDALHLSESAFTLTDSLKDQPLSHAPRPTDGIAALLDHLTSAGIRCGVISNDHMEGIRTFLCDHGLAGFFKGTWSAEHHPTKPHPGAVHGLCRRLGIGPDQCALIGDANSDLRMAREAGVGVVLGYPSGWAREVTLDPAFKQVRHWNELRVVSEF